MNIRLRYLGCFVAILTGMASSALACRYSVRDVGFVDLGAAPYRLFVCVPESQETAIDELTTAMHVSLLDANIAGEMLLVSDSRRGSLSIRLPKENRTPLCDWETLAAIQERFARQKSKPGSTILPVGVLVAPDGRLWEIDAPAEKRETKPRLPKTVQPQPAPPQPMEGLKSKVQAIARMAATSPLREQLSTDLLEAHSVLLLVEGDDGARNLAAKELAKQAIDGIEAGLGNLPKAIANPPILVVVPAQDIAKEAVLLWSLGVPAEETDAAHLVVLFGRMRKMGDVLTVPGATERDLAGPLYFIGQDCECELDRSIMQGIMAPHTWAGKLEADAARQLGFDPGHAMVKVEMSRILAQGPSSGRRQLGVGVPGFNPRGHGLGGYTEIIIEPLAPNDEESTEPTEPTASDPPGLPGTSTVASGRGKPADSAPDSPEPASSQGIWWILGGGAVVVLLLSGLVLWRTRGEG